MRHSLRVWSFIGLLSLLFPAAFVQAQTPGTPSDPLVTKSYLDRVFRFQPILVPTGQVVRLQTGALLVLRMGKARISSGGGFLDITAGKETASGSLLVTSHLYIAADPGTCAIEALTNCRIVVAGHEPEAAGAR